MGKITPGFYVSEVDFSEYAPETTDGGSAIVGGGLAGPVGVGQSVRDGFDQWRELVSPAQGLTDEETGAGPIVPRPHEPLPAGVIPPGWRRVGSLDIWERMDRCIVVSAPAPTTQEEDRLGLRRLTYVAKVPNDVEKRMEHLKRNGLIRRWADPTAAMEAIDRQKPLDAAKIRSENTLHKSSFQLRLLNEIEDASALEKHLP